VVSTVSVRQLSKRWHEASIIAGAGNRFYIAPSSTACELIKSFATSDIFAPQLVGSPSEFAKKANDEISVGRLELTTLKGETSHALLLPDLASESW